MLRDDTDLSPCRDRRGRRNERRGAAATELAICMPVIVLLIFASIECCSMLFVDEALHVACYESLRVAIQKDGVASDAIVRGEEVLEQFGVAEGTITCQPSDLSSAQGGDTIVIEVEAPCNANSIMPAWFFGGATLRARCAMARE